MNLLSLFISFVFLPTLRELPVQLPTESDKIQDLIEVAQSSNFWISVHAIEYLAKLGYKKEAKALALTQLKPFEETPEKRIGFWRAQSLASKERNERNFWINKIKNAYLNTSGPDRIHAAESLAKLGVSFKNLSPKIVRKDLVSEGMIFSFSHWGYCLPIQAGERPNYSALLEIISKVNAKNRSLFAYALGFLVPDMNKDTWETLANLALNEESNSETYVYLIGAAYIHYNRTKHHADDTFQDVRNRLLRFEYSQKKLERIELCKALATNYLAQDRMIIERVLSSNGPSRYPADSKVSLNQDDADKLDIKAAAAYTWLQMNAQQNK